MPGEVKPAMTVAATPSSPEYIQLANNVEIIESIQEAMSSGSATFTHEGYFGPLLFGEELRAYTLRLEPGMFLSEHPHPTESIVYTLSGRYVLCSEGKRKVMEAGSIFHFGSNMPTGWEAPFAEGAEILIFKKKRDGDDYDSFVTGIGEMAATLDVQMKDGEPFYYHQLPADPGRKTRTSMPCWKPPGRPNNPHQEQIIKENTHEKDVPCRFSAGSEFGRMCDKHFLRSPCVRASCANRCAMEPRRCD
ncbi:MAG: hypothetical protein B7X53_13975 [Hyphomonas sp. 34-62-18]|nr:MAG: hypothetical protein B7X53_13975 [Hyphomonas sp. 34-62-18]